MPSLRLDRVLTLGLARPYLKATKTHKRSGIPILMYHSITETQTAASSYFETHTGPQLFACQMAWLRESGYRAITLHQAMKFLPADQDDKTVVITFDDGYKSVYTSALPVLKDCEFTATVFVVSEFARMRASDNGNTEYMNWNEVRDLHSYGMEIGSHTATHASLRQLGQEEVDEELSMSRLAIEDELGAAVSSFSYPFAFPEHDQEFVSRLNLQLQAHGYQQAVTTVVGTAKAGGDRFLLPRLPINAHDDLSLFRAKIERAYDWMHLPQSAWKFVQSCGSAVRYSDKRTS